MSFFVCTALVVSAFLSGAIPQDTNRPEFQVRASAHGLQVSLSGSASNHATTLVPSASLFRVFRGLNPHFSLSRTSLLGEFVPNGTSLFVDEAKGIKPGTIVYYKVEAVEGSKVLALTPYGLSPLKTSAALSAAATVPYPPLNVVFIGDSITEGGWINKPDMNACEACAHALELGPKARLVFFSNQGHSGHTTKDYLPEWEDFTNAEAAAKKLEAEAPGELVFSVMLGTNDSANDGPNGSPANVDQYEANLKSTISALLHDFPQCKVVVHRPIWYSSNTHNGANYEETGLERLTTYFPVVERLAKAFPKGKVFVGDERGYSYFAEAYRGTLRVEHGRNGTFYLHPDPKGALDLGQLWANAILRAVG